MLFVGGMVCTSALAAGMQDDAPLDPAALTASMQSLAKTRDAQKKKFFQAVYEKLQHEMQQSGNAGNYFFRCLKDEKYSGLKNGNADYAKWKTDNRDLFSDRDIERAAGLHLRYLALTLKRAASDSVEPVLPELQAYLADLNNSRDLVGPVKRNPEQVKFRIYDPKQGGIVDELVGNIQALGQGGTPPVHDDPHNYVDMLLNSSVGEGFVAKSLGVAGLIGNVSPWEQSAGNLSGILEQDLRPYLREKKNPRLLDTWDLEISFSQALASANPDGKVVEKFQREEYPRLLWRKAADLELLGMPNRALKQRIAVAQQFPQSPDFEAWMGEINKQIEASAVKPKESPSAGAAQSPASATPTPESTPAT